MYSKRLGVGIAVVNRLLYAIGGYDGTFRLSSAECYHPENDAWNMISPMNTVRSGAGKFFNTIVCILLQKLILNRENCLMSVQEIE